MLSDLFLKTKGITFFRFSLFFFFFLSFKNQLPKAWNPTWAYGQLKQILLLNFHLLDSMMTWFHIMLSCKDKDSWLQIRAVCGVGVRDRGRGIRREGERPQPILGLVNSPTFPYAACKFHPGPRWSYTCHLPRPWPLSLRPRPQFKNHSSTAVSHDFKGLHERPSAVLGYQLLLWIPNPFFLTTTGSGSCIFSTNMHTFIQNMFFVFVCLF